MLYAFARNVTGDGRVFVLAADLVNFIYVDDSGLGSAYVAVGSLQQLQNNVFNIFADISGFSQRGCINNREWNVEHPGQSLSHQRFTGAGWPNQHDVRLRKLNAIASGLRPIHVDPLVVVVNRHGEFLLGLFLADNVLVQESFDFMRLRKLVRSSGRRCCRAVIFENGVADRDTLVANVGPGIVARGRDQLGNGVLRLVAERAAQNFFSSGPVFHSAQLLLVASNCLVALGQRGKPEILRRDIRNTNHQKADHTT